MKANPGGQIDLKAVVGRDDVIEQIWQTLEQQSIRMNAERRIGKTTIIKKLCNEPKEGWLPIFQDLEQYHTAIEFAASISREVEKHLPKTKQAAGILKKLITAVGGVEVGGILKLPKFEDDSSWKDVLCNSIQGLVEGCESEGLRPLFLWDEVPFMLENIKSRDGEQVAMEVLDTLRALRQTYETRGLRMILTGSIGLHHVIKSLKRSSYANAPVNDMLTVAISALSEKSAQELASRLIEGEGIPTEYLDETSMAVAKISDGFPFYIHHIIKAMKRSGEDGSVELVESIVSQQLITPDDPWELHHYTDRVATYYGEEHKKSVLGILDTLALQADSISVNGILTELKSMGVLDDRDLLIELLKLIEQDHYLARNHEGRYEFQFPLLKRWWTLARGLED
jgi:hypothetical protein